MRLIFALILLATASSLHASSGFAYKCDLESQRKDLEFSAKQQLKVYAGLFNAESKRQQSCCFWVREKDRQYLVSLADKMTLIRNEFARKDAEIALKIAECDKE